MFNMTNRRVDATMSTNWKNQNKTIADCNCSGKCCHDSDQNNCGKDCRCKKCDCSAKVNKRLQQKPKQALELAQEYVDFMNACKSPWHVVERVRTTLEAAGFRRLSMEDSAWNVQPGQKYYVVKGGSTILAFALGGNWTPTSRIAFSVPHSDSPALRIKPDSNRGGHEFIQVGCGLYGGGFWHTWFDRDLGIAGRVFVRNGNSIETRLLTINRPLANVPSLAIHFDSTMNTELRINFETELLPMIGLGDHNEDPDAPHQPMLLDLLAAELNVDKDDIVEFELNMFDTHPATIGGINNDFIFGQFQDNQYCSFASLKALIDAVNLPGFATAKHAYLYATYNHEEVGNRSDVGASSDWTKQVLYRICGKDNFAAVIDKSFALSADVDHGVNPNYSQWYEVNSRPALDGGPVIKYNYALEMATNAESACIVREIGRRAGVEIQGTIPRNGKRTGSTHGPSLSALLGITTCDLGPPLMAMHSIRETTGTMGLWNLTRFIEYFYREFDDVMDNMVGSVRQSREKIMENEQKRNSTMEKIQTRNQQAYSPALLVDQNGDIMTDNHQNVRTNFEWFNNQQPLQWMNQQHPQTSSTMNANPADMMAMMQQHFNANPYRGIMMSMPGNNQPINCTMTSSTPTSITPAIGHPPLMMMDPTTFAMMRNMNINGGNTNTQNTK